MAYTSHDEASQGRRDGIRVLIGEPQRVAGHRRVKRLLRDEATAARDVAALHMGRILVLAQVQQS